METLELLAPAGGWESLKAAADAEKRGWATSEQKTNEYLDLLKKNGMTVYAPSPQLKSDMQKVGEVMLKEWQEKAGPEGKAVIDAYRAGK